MFKKISVIIPVYNGEAYLERCLKSVFGQVNFDTNDLEILILNDGSTDGSRGIIERYKAAHHDIILAVHQLNKGIAKTRNTGIDLAHGIYIMFLDQDDYFDADYCRTFYDAIEASQADVVSGGYRRPDSRGKIHQVNLPKIGSEYAKYIMVAAWAKIHRTEFLRANKIKFFDNKFGEDHVFTIKEIVSTQHWQQINYIGYNWFLNKCSVSSASQKGLTLEDQASLLTLLACLIKVHKNRQGQALFQYYLLRTVTYYLLFAGQQATPQNFIKSFLKLLQFLETEYPRLYKNQYLPFGPVGETIAARGTILGFVLLRKLRLERFFARLYCHTKA